ncbi:MAG: response regulator transcription factor [Calditrichaeota bacterium]|nr:response regulator transcription factor [Calditrichota bacterium]
MKLLIIEDEPEMLNSITSYLAKSGYVCEIASTYDEADEKLWLYEYDCIILDISLPDGSGLDILKELKKSQSTTGVIIVSARNSLDDKIKGLNLGADDYLPKPFHLTELHARVNAIIRRKQFEGNNEIILQNLVIDLDNKNISVNNNEITLTKKEYELLLFFVSNKNRVISKTSLAEHIWGDNTDQVDSYDFLYSQIKNLRKKLKEFASIYNIQAVYGLGYKFCLAE